MCNLKDKLDNATCLPAPSTIDPDEKEFAVDSGASMHMLSKKNLYAAELETVRTSRNPTTVFAANRDVQTKEEAKVYVRGFEFICDCAAPQEYTARSITWATMRRVPVPHLSLLHLHHRTRCKRNLCSAQSKDVQNGIEEHSKPSVKKGAGRQGITRRLGAAAEYPGTSTKGEIRDA